MPRDLDREPLGTTRAAREERIAVGVVVVGATVAESGGELVGVGGEGG